MLIDAKPFHCGQMARRLRGEHKALLLGMGVNPHEELRECFDDSSYRKAMFVGDRLIALSGVTGSVSSSEGMIWLALVEDADRYAFRLARTMLRELDQIMVVKRLLKTVVLRADGPAVQLAYFLGFNAEKSDKINGTDVLVMSYQRAIRKVA